MKTPLTIHRSEPNIHIDHELTRYSNEKLAQAAIREQELLDAPGIIDTAMDAVLFLNRLIFSISKRRRTK